MSKAITLASRFAQWLYAGVPLLWVRTREAQEAIREMAKAAKAESGWKTHVWNASSGLDGSEETPDPSRLLAFLMECCKIKRDGEREIVFTTNLHFHLKDADTIARIAEFFEAGKRAGVVLVNCSPNYNPPAELVDLWTVEALDLPNSSQRLAILKGLADKPGDMTDSDERMINATAGLTRFHCEQLASWCLANEDKVSYDSMMNLKISQLKENNVCQIVLPESGFESIGGLVNAKDFCTRLLAGKGKKPAKGILALGVPGTGKTAFARALAKETGRALIIASIANLKGGIQGSSENNLRTLLSVADQMGSDGAKAILFFDEIEKGLAGVESSAKTDGGVLMSMYGELLKWLNDHTSDVLTFGTCNNVGALASESGGAFIRSGRFDAKLFWDYPTTEEKRSIWQIHLAGYGLAKQKPAPDEGWTGADIEQACRLADTLQITVAEAANLINPMKDKGNEDTRRWAESAGCISASYAGLFKCNRSAPAVDDAGPRRSVSRKPLFPESGEQN